MIVKPFAKVQFLIFASFFAAIFPMSNFAANIETNSDNGIPLIGIQKAIDDYRVANDVPGMQLSISIPGEYNTYDFVSGTTTKDGTTPISMNNLFQFGSNTKSFTATIILQLEEENLLSIDDPITKYLPQYPQWKNITIKQLLHHTSGIFNFTNDPDFMKTLIDDPTRIRQPGELVAVAIKHGQDFPPGTNWEYSNTNFILLGMIIEKVTPDHSYDNQIKKRLLQSPNINLINTFFENQKDYSPDVLNRMAHGYLNLQGYDLDITEYNTSWGGSAGGIISNTRDFALWARALFQQYKALDSNQLAKMEDLVCTGSPDDNCIAGQKATHVMGGYGTGIAEILNNQFGPLWGHDGGMLGYITEFMWIPNYDTVIAFATNIRNDKNDANYDKLIAQILDILYHSNLWQNYRETHNLPYIENSNQQELIKALHRLSFDRL